MEENNEMQEMTEIDPETVVMQATPEIPPMPETPSIPLMQRIQQAPSAQFVYTNVNSVQNPTGYQPQSMEAQTAQSMQAYQAYTPQPQYQAPYQPQYQTQYQTQYQAALTSQGILPLGLTKDDQPQEKTPVKKKSPIAHFFGILGIAVCSGALAATAYIGVNHLYNHFYPQSQKEAPGHFYLEEASETLGDQGIDSGIGMALETEKTQIEKSTVIGTQYSPTTIVSEIAEKAMPSTVSITSTFLTNSWYGRYETPGSGSGIIIGKNDSELLIVTNNHVIDGANKIRVTLIDDTEVDAIVKGTASYTDLAVVAISLKDLSEETLNAIKIATLGSSDETKVGEMVVAIGNALGYGQSVTVGYISAKNREITVDNHKMTLLQTDAAINPGNSGGALLNLKGEVIGINSIKYAREEVEGVCFAIPVSNVGDIIENLLESIAEDEKGYLGVGINDVTQTIADYYQWPLGIYVVNFATDSAAQAAGIQIGDIITGVNGIVVETSDELIERVTANRYGTTVTITVQRNVDGAFEEMSFDVVLRPKSEIVVEE